MDRPLSRVGGRRFVMTIGCGAVCTLLLVFDKLDAITFRDIIIATVAVYIAGNTYQKSKSDSGENSQ